MRQSPRFAAIGLAAGFAVAGLLLATAGPARAQAITASNAWARRAAAMDMGSHGSMDKMGQTDKGGKMDKMAQDKGGMAGIGDGSTSAVYLTLTNPGSQADALVSASTDAAQAAELHETKNESGIMKMRPVKTIPVPAKGKTVLKPGGYHIMLMGLKHDLKPGDRVAVTLQFEHAGPVHVEAPVK